MNKTTHRIRFALMLFFTVVLFAADGQSNLLNNDDFELHDHCPVMPTTYSSAQIEYCTGWSAPTGGTSDYFNACNATVVSTPSNFKGYQAPYSGTGYCGFYAVYIGHAGYTSPTCYNGAYYTEYIQGKFVQELVADHTYFIQFHFSLADESTLAVKQLGFYISDSPIYDSCLTGSLNVVPQIHNLPGTDLSDTTNWFSIGGNYKALGGEKFITIGNFKDSLSKDTISIQYGLEKDSYYYVDAGEVMDVTLSVPNVFTPNGDGVNDFFFIDGMLPGDRVEIFNRWGMNLFTGDGTVFWNGRDKEDKKCVDGVYFYRIMTSDPNRRNLTGFVQLIR